MGDRRPIRLPSRRCNDVRKPESLLFILESAVPRRHMVHLRKVRPSDETAGAGVTFVEVRPITAEEEPRSSE